MKNKINFLKENSVVHESSIEIRFRPSDIVFFIDNNTIYKASVLAVKIEITMLELATEQKVMYELSHGTTFSDEFLYPSVDEIPIKDFSVAPEPYSYSKEEDLPF